MFCNLCGANIPDGSPRCSKCKNFFPKNLGAYTYKVILVSFSDYTAKKETAKFLAARTPDATLGEVVKRLDSLPLVIAKRVDEKKARELEEALTRLGARTRFRAPSRKRTGKGPAYCGAQTALETILYRG